MANNRIYYAIQQVLIGGTAVKGLQSVGITTNFNLEQVFELGQLSIYQNVENVPDVEVTLTKVLDGTPLIYALATETTSAMGGEAATAASIPGRQNARCDLELGIFPDTSLSASGTPISAVVCSGMYVGSVSYTFPVDGNFTEDVTLVGNNKVWTGTSAGQFNNQDEPQSDTGVGRRQYINFDASRFPNQIPGIENGTNPKVTGSGHAAHFQNITVSCDFGREAMNELGTFAPYHRFVTFPVEVTCEFEVMAVEGDMINATESGYYTGLEGDTVATGEPATCEARHNLVDETIFIETCEGTRINLGTKNKLTSVNYTGGDTGGGNVSVTYNYTTYNDLEVAHSAAGFYSTVSAGAID